LRRLLQEKELERGWQWHARKRRGRRRKRRRSATVNGEFVRREYRSEVAVRITTVKQ